jgi:hypothetical protein
MQVREKGWGESSVVLLVNAQWWSGPRKKVVMVVTTRQSANLVGFAVLCAAPKRLSGPD